MIRTLYLFLFAFLPISLLSLASPLCSPAQTKQLDAVQVKWEILENNYQGTTQTLSVLTLSVTNSWKLPATGWRIYFNFARPIKKQEITGGLKIVHINGDFFYMEPQADFKGLKAGESVQTAFVSGDWVVNRTDSPSGFYLVWDSKPDQYEVLNKVSSVPSTKAKQVQRITSDRISFQTPAMTYAANRSIKDLQPPVKIFPTPSKYQEKEGAFRLTGVSEVRANAAFAKEATQLKQFISGLLTTTKLNKENPNQIQLVQQDLPENAYELKVSPQGITIAAANATGIFYGIQSLKTLVPPQNYAKTQHFVLIPAVEVFDTPRFGYRAFMLDVARNFQSKAQVLKLLDLMALYKLNVLHFHLNDDEGWRLEIPALPELTTIGSQRGHTLDNKTHLQPALGSGPEPGHAYGSGFYTRADFIEILKYANDRHIEVIPEIESPGHARAAVKAMAARNDPKYLLHEPGDSSVYRSVQYWNDNVMNVALPSVYNFIETITQQVQAMYAEAGAPLKTIHYGGDEVPVGVWERSPAVKALMQQNPEIKTADDLWVYYYRKVDAILKAHGLYLTAWEEVGTRKVLKNGKKETDFNEDMLGKNVHLEVWNNMMGWGAEDLAYKLANKGYKVILSPVTNMYFDMAYQKSFDEPGYYWGGYADLDKSFNFIPEDYFRNTKTDRMGNPLSAEFLAGKERLTEAGRKNIVGLQGALWSEVVKGPQLLEYMILPKILGLAERAWAQDPAWAQQTDPVKFDQQYQQAWSEFANVVGKRELPRLSHYAGGFQYRIPAPGVLLENGTVKANLQLPGFTIRYTTDGSAPNKNSRVYTGPVRTRGLIKLAAFNANGRAGQVVSVQNNLGDVPVLPTKKL